MTPTHHPVARTLVVRAIVACGLLAAGGLLTACSDAGEPAPVDRPPDLVIPVADAPSPPAPAKALRAQVVDLDTDVLHDAAGEPHSVRVRLDLFGETDYATHLTYADSHGVQQWTGALSGVAMSTVVLVRAGGAYRMTVNSPAHVFAVAPGSGGHYLLTEVDPAGEPPDPELSGAPAP